MVRVVSAPPVKQCNCPTCQAVLEYSFADIREEYIRDYGGGGDTYYRITCPNCDKVMNVSRWGKQ